MDKASLAHFGLDRPALIAMLLIGGVGIAALAAWLAFGTGFYMTLFDSVLAWCM